MVHVKVVLADDAIISAGQMDVLQVGQSRGSDLNKWRDIKAVRGANPIFDMRAEGFAVQINSRAGGVGVDIGESRQRTDRLANPEDTAYHPAVAETLLHSHFQRI